MHTALQQSFAAPGNAFRGKPFWAWNGKLEPEELRRQVRLLHRMGLGGFFMHARVGLGTRYLSPEWFDGVKACIDEAQQLGMEAWLYDEDRWPSGAAGGLVTKDPQYRSRHLFCHPYTKAKDFTWSDCVLAAFTAKLDGHRATKVTPLTRGVVPARLGRGETLLAFTVEISKNSDWYNGFTYLDTLSHAAVAKFIEVTHEAYAKQVGEHFGKTVPGIFADEPNHGGQMEGAGWLGNPEGLITPWTDRLPEIFQQRYGYDLLPHLVELFYDVDGQAVSQPRYHYQDCTTHLFVDAFGRQIGEWCEAHGIAFTGHVLEEDSLKDQVNMVGSCMRFYEHMQAPGMDLLTEHWRIYDTAKQVSSAAHQFGRAQRLTETYGCTGWDFPFEGHKALGDWQAALGINLFCQHLSWYTMEGEAKRDYPAGIFYQSPWWELYPTVQDYFARIFTVMTKGEEVRDILVIHPVESMWTKVRQGWHHDADIKAMDVELPALRDALLSAQLDFDYGDEELLARHGAVVEPGPAGSAPRLQMARASYRVVVVPPQITMRRSTLTLLQRFQAVGGVVIFAGAVATHVDALPSADVAAFAATCVRAPAKGAKLAAAVAPAGRRLTLTTADGQPVPGVIYLLREDADACYLFLCNTSEDFRQHLSARDGEPLVRDRKVVYPAVTLTGFAECGGTPLELDPATGAIYRADAKATRNGWVVQTSFPRVGSRLFVFPRQEPDATPLPPKRPTATPVRATTLKPARWTTLLSEDNVLVLDRPRLRLGDGEWQAATDVIRVDRTVRTALGVPVRAGWMKQPWARAVPAAPKQLRVTLAYDFTVKTLPSGQLFLAVERPETFAICVNGHALSLDAASGWWCDRSLRKLPVDPATLRVGQNEITMVIDYDETHSGLEIAYLLGNFGVKLAGPEITMVAPVTSLKLGDWVPQGLAFYAGNVAYQTTVRPTLTRGQRLLVEVPAYRGVALRVWANGQLAGVAAWEPNTVDLTAFVGKGPLELRIEVIGHRRNSHGPLHLTQQWPTWTGPGEFTPGDDRFQESYNLVPAGLMAPPRLVVTKK